MTLTLHGAAFLRHFIFLRGGLLGALEWEGFVTLEIGNTAPWPVKIYANEGLRQVIFFASDDDCEIWYKDKKRKYQSPGGIVLPRL